MKNNESTLTRKAILLSCTSDINEGCKAEFDFSLVRSFLCSAQGGCFEEHKIIKIDTNTIDKQSLIELIDSVDYSFFYFSGHAGFSERKIQIPFINDELITEVDLIRSGKKQWIFFDCCRTENVTLNSPAFTLPRHTVVFTPKSDSAFQKWCNDVVNSVSFYFVYYTTALGGYAFTNEFGGYGTQLFFMTLMEELQKNNRVDIEKLIADANSKSTINQKSSFVSAGVNVHKYPFKFSLAS